MDNRDHQIQGTIRQKRSRQTKAREAVDVIGSIRARDPIGAVVVSCLENIHVALLATLPGVMAAMVQSRVDRIKLALATRLYLSKDDAELADVKIFLELIALRPFEMRILRLISVDMNLPADIILVELSKPTIVLNHYNTVQSSETSL
ncbi:hypothetical protein EVAR_32830_1 [Eumeta japonica]|uniref:Uncharacterized protein n=1 Tax=Eumeta variegata TaxID=151549 RepID=A0A4C1WD81_EUMVA|nr:hypothetical protein EVAR_32830_1 [Eumeta japonica]